MAAILNRKTMDAGDLCSRFLWSFWYYFARTASSWPLSSSSSFSLGARVRSTQTKIRLRTLTPERSSTCAASRSSLSWRSGATHSCWFLIRGMCPVATATSKIIWLWQIVTSSTRSSWRSIQLKGSTLTAWKGCRKAAFMNPKYQRTSPSLVRRRSD